MRRKKLILIITIVVAIIALVIFGIHHLDQNRNSQKRLVQEPVEAGFVTIDNTDELSKVLLSEQYTALYNFLNNFILTRVSKSTQHAVLLGSPIIQPNGNIKITVKTDKPSKQFDVLIDRNTHFDELTISIPSYNLQKTIQVYGAKK